MATTSNTPTGSTPPTPASGAPCAPAGARAGAPLACTLLPPAGAARRKQLTHYEHKPVQGSSDHYVTSHYSDGGYIRRRYNADGFMIDVDPVFVVAL